jgi:hypothetical protein
MMRCSHCGCEKFYKESEFVIRCEDCFLPITKLDSNQIGDFNTPKNTNISKKSNNKKPLPKSEPKKDIPIIVNRLKMFVFVFIAMVFFNIFKVFINNKENLENIFTSISNEIHSENSEQTDAINSIDVTLEEFSYLKNSIGMESFVGYLKNTSDSTKSILRVVVNFYNESGEKIGQIEGYPDKNLIEPNSRAMISIYMKDPIEFDRYEAIVEESTGNYGGKNMNLEILQSKLVKQDDGYYIQGVIKNQNSEVISYPHVNYFIRDNNQNIIFYSSEYFSIEKLNQNEKADFSIQIYLPEGELNNYELEGVGLGTL